jgi:CHASE2 domain-containing sensor protein
MAEEASEGADAGRLVGGRYRLEARLGEGAMGVVWRARHEALGRTFALKVLRPEVAADPPAQARFAREAEALGRLRHPHIVGVTDFGFDERDGAPYLVMEHLEGATLAERLEEGPLPFPEALAVLTDVATAIDAAHDGGVLHRDLKPANVVLSGTAAKVLDFGLAQLGRKTSEDGDLVAGTGGEPRLTEAGMLMGTPLYIAPELIRDPRAGSRASDIYAFAAMAYEVLAGRPPFRGTTHEVLQAHLNTPPPAPAMNAPAGVWEALRQGLAKDPASRPTRAGEVVARIQDALRQDEARQSEGRRRRRGAWLSAAVAVTTGLLALGPLRPLLSALERRAADLRFRLAAPVKPDPRLLVIALDDAAGVPGVSSLADAGDVIAPVLERALDAGAHGVAIDLLLPRKWSESERFSALLLRHPERITLAAYSGEGEAVIGTDCVAGLTAVALGPERTAALFGFVNLDEDADRVTRRAHHAFRDVAGRERPSWAAKTALRLQPQAIVPAADPIWIDHRLRVEDVPRLSWSAAERLATAQPEAFRDRLLLVGVESPASGDDLHLVPRPSASIRGVSGLGLQALIVDTMARGRPIREVSPAAFQAVAVLALGALAGGLLCYGRTTWVLAIAAVGALAYAWMAIAALNRAGLLLPMAQPIAILALGLLLAATARAFNR